MASRHEVPQKKSEGVLEKALKVSLLAIAALVGIETISGN